MQHKIRCKLTLRNSFFPEDVRLMNSGGRRGVVVFIQYYAASCISAVSVHKTSMHSDVMCRPSVDLFAVHITSPCYLCFFTSFVAYTL